MSNLKKKSKDSKEKFNGELNFGKLSNDYAGVIISPAKTAMAKKVAATLDLSKPV